MNVEKIKEFLRTEYGISSESEFDMAFSELIGIDLGIFTMPFKRSIKSEQDDKVLASA
jgi:hypothetical protein